MTAITITAERIPGAVHIDGYTGKIRLKRATGQSFRRPGDDTTGYQQLGAEAGPSTLTYWHGVANAAAATQFIASIDKLLFLRAKITTHTETVSCVLTAHEVTLTRACAGAAAWRVEGTITLEALQ